jgi:RNA polymerase sigma-70 factor (ECF subfamily)
MHVTLREDIEKLTPSLRRFARALVAHEPDDAPDIADNLVHDALARAWRADWSRRTQDPRLFLYAAITSSNRQRMRTRPPAQAPAERVGPSSASGGGPSASSQSSAPCTLPNARRHGVTHALDAMALEDREAFLLVVLEGLTYAEAGDVLGIPRGALTGRLMKARQKLSASLDAPNPGDPRPKPARTYLRIVK